MPVAITRHGETIGYYVPARHASPEQAALQFEKLLSSQGVTEEELLSEFRQLKKVRNANDAL